MPVPAAPTGLSATAITASRINLAWVDASSDETSFSVEQSPNGTTGWVEIATPAANAVSYSVTGLAENTTFYFRVRAHNGSGYSTYSNSAHATTLLVSVFTEPRLFLLQPQVVFAARVVLLDPADYPVSFVAYDTVTTGAYTDIRPGMTLLLGSTAGGDDYGRQRIRDEATTISIFVGRSSQGRFDGELTIVNDAYITVWDDRRLWAKMPYIDDTGAIFVDSDLEVGDRTTNPPPVAVMGQGVGGTVDADTGTLAVFFNGQNSYAVADGATITDFLWEIADGSFTGGSVDSDDSIATEFEPGFRYVRLTVTDSNGKTGYTERPVVADDLDHSLTFDGFQIESHRITDAGVTMTLRILEDMPRATYIDGTLAMMWGRELTAGNMLLVGWLDSEEANHNAGRTGLLRDTTLTILDAAAKLDTLPGFPQAIADDETRDTELIPEITWNYMIAPTMDKYMHYLWAWFSTALEVTDFIWSGTGDAYAIAIKTSDGESLWNQVSRVAQAMCPGYVLTCDQAGAIRVVSDPLLQELDDRTSVVQVAITEDDWSDLRFTYQRAPRTHWLRTGALVVQSAISFNPLPEGADPDTPPTVFLPTVFSIAPGNTPGQGLAPVDYNEQLAASQTVLNQATGHRYARMNSPYGLLTVTLVQDDGGAGALVPWRQIEPALKEWVTFTLSAANAAQRGLSFTSVRCLPKEVNIRYNVGRTGTTRTIEVTLEVETSGQPGATVVKPVVPPPGEQPNTIPPAIPPPDMGLITGQDLVAGIGKFKVYRTFDFTTPSGSGGPTWDAKDLTGADEMLTWVVDPFSPGYIEGTGSIDGWAASATKLYRLTDLFGATPAATAVITFPHTALWRTIQASFGTYFVAGDNPWLICISYYGSLGGHSGTWCTYSKDGGATWFDEVVVSGLYDSGGASNPIGLYCSPKTPGLAYTVAHVETANPALAGGYVSTDWGATWTAMGAVDDPDFPLPKWGYFDDDDAFSFQATGRVGHLFNECLSTGPVKSVVTSIVMAPPPDAVRVEISAAWTAFAHKASLGSVGGGSTLNKPSAVTRTIVSNDPGAFAFDTVYSGSFVHTYTYGGAPDWPEVNSETIISSPPVTPKGVRFGRNDIGSGNGTHLWYDVYVTVTEIELKDGTIYQPVDPGIIQPLYAQAGELHLPWESNPAEDIFYYGQLNRTGNRLFALMRATSGTVEDISPNDGSKDYGINAGAFSVRAHDADRQLILAAVTGNDATTSAANDKQGVYASIDGGDTWTAIVAPTTGTEVYQAAWSGDLDGTVYLWGPAHYMGFSSNSGVSIDSRAGNLAALSATKLIGLAGGPPP